MTCRVLSKLRARFDWLVMGTSGGEAEWIHSTTIYTLSSARYEDLDAIICD